MNQIVNKMEMECECAECETLSEIELPIIDLEIVVEEEKKQKKQQQKLNKEILQIMEKSKFNNKYLQELKSPDIERSKVFHSNFYNY